MFVLYAEKTRLSVREREPVTSGSVNTYPVRFEFSADWDGLGRTAVFQAGCTEKAVVLTGGACTIPAEVLAISGYYLMVGVCGGSGNSVVLPTIWANLGLIHEGAVPGEVPDPGSQPEDWQEELDKKGDTLGYTDGGELGLYAGERLLSALPLSASDHRRLSHLEDPDQHPMEAISGLKKELARIPEPVEALTNAELEEMLK